MRGVKLLCAAAVLATLPACSSLGAGEGIGNSYYALVRVRSIQVGDGSMAVTPPRPWNRARRVFFDDVRWVEDWTLNGPYLDGITFVAGLPNDKYLIRQRRSEERQVPRFRSDMTVPEITALLESAWRVRGGAIDFRTLALTPRPFLGTGGFQFDYEHLDTDELWRKGRAVGAIVNGRLYLIMYDGARSHYYNAALGDFEAIANSARLR
ncbi:hypothetical protein [Sphingomonas sp.]|uniref:hypothetical protein n=1 Tax=Sphingomonas sp. TaxID=28214 RepID=UPI00286E95CF|nr:hypothetical protein [Sphingomonas sp.]